MRIVNISFRIIIKFYVRKIQLWTQMTFVILQWILDARIKTTVLKPQSITKWYTSYSHKCLKLFLVLSIGYTCDNDNLYLHTHM